MTMIHSRRANFTGRFHLFVEKRIKLKPEGKKPKLRKKNKTKKTGVGWEGIVRRQRTGWEGETQQGICCQPSKINWITSLDYIDYIIHTYLRRLLLLIPWLYLKKD